jgi:multimeric flavodoxin WrbA
MRVVGLAGSPRAWNSSTLRLVTAAAMGASGEGADVEVIEAAHLSIRRCRGCGRCFSTGRCVQDDDLSYLLERLDAADGVIMGSPAYAGGVTAPVETIMERMVDAAHCRRFEGKYCAAISISRDGDERYVLEHIGRFLDGCGLAMVGGLAVHFGGEGDLLESASTVGRELAMAINEKRRFPEHEEAKERFLRDFRETIVSNRETWAHDYRHWLEKGWV